MPEAMPGLASQRIAPLAVPAANRRAIARWVVADRNLRVMAIGEIVNADCRRKSSRTQPDLPTGQ